MCWHRQQFQHDVQHWAVVLIINIINFIQQRFGAGRTINAATAASPVRWLQFVENHKLVTMTIEEIKEYFKNKVYQAHPEYEIEIISPQSSGSFYLIVHLGNGYCYCFLLLPCTSKNQYENQKPSADILNNFMKQQFSNCVLKKVCLIYQSEKGDIVHKTFAPENI